MAHDKVHYLNTIGSTDEQANLYAGKVHEETINNQSRQSFCLYKMFGAILAWA